MVEAKLRTSGSVSCLSKCNDQSPNLWNVGALNIRRLHIDLTTELECKGSNGEGGRNPTEDFHG